MNNTVKELKKVLSGESVTLEMLQEGKEIYKTIAQEGYKSKKWTNTNLALAILNRAFKRYLDNTDLKEYRKTVFINDKGIGYNAVLSNQDQEQVLSIKIKSESFVMDLIDNHGFYLNV